MKIVIRFLCVGVPALLALYLASCHRQPTQRERDLAVYPDRLQGVPVIRVKIEEDAREVALRSDGPVTVHAQPADPDEDPLAKSDNPITYRVTATNLGIRLGEHNELPYPSLTVVPAAGVTLFVGDTPFTLPVTLQRVMGRGDGAPALNVIVRMNMEEYLVGVVPSEMPSNWPPQALKAQCVAARTYALYKIQTRRDITFDVTNTQASQVWKPAVRKNPLINSVVNETRGVVLTDNYRLFPTYFSSQCGGITKNGAGVFVSRHINPLSEVTCPYCSGRPGANHWQYTLTLDAIGEALRTGKYKDVAKVTAIGLLDETGRPARKDDPRVYDVAVTHTGTGSPLKLAAQDFRSVVGGGLRQMASTFYTMETTGGQVTFSGRGHGHGVGMCQYGAAHLANQGQTYQEILRYYYRGNTLVRLWDGGPADK